MSDPITLHLRPAAADLSLHHRTKVRLCSFPASQRRGQKRYLRAGGERIVCHTSEERIWWKRMVTAKDALRLNDDDAKKLDASYDEASKKIDELTKKLAGEKGEGDKGKEAKATLQKQLADAKASDPSRPWGGPPPIDKGSENVPEFKISDSKRGGK